jgi:hypothetical protein
MTEDQKQKLEQQLWNIANELRGKMGADEFRDYILGFIFYKYLSEKQHLYANKLLETEAVKDYADVTDEEDIEAIKEESLIKLGYFLHPNELFGEISRKGNADVEEESNFILEDLQSILNSIEQSTMGTESEDDFNQLFEDLDLGSTKLGRSVEARNTLIAKVLSHLDKIDFALEDGRVLTAWLGLGAQEAQKSHGLCNGKTPDIANLPAGEVYFVPCDARGQFPMKYEDGTLGVLDVEDRCIVRSTLIEGNPATIAEHNQRLVDDPMTGTLGELGFGTQVLPVSGADIQDEKVLGTCHMATGRDDHLGGDILPSMFKKHENSTHDDILFAPHKTPNFNISQVRMKRGAQEEILIENFRPSRFLMDALSAGR